MTVPKNTGSRNTGRMAEHRQNGYRLLEQQIQHERELREKLEQKYDRELLHEKELRKQTEQMNELALGLQAEEYKRRFAEGNDHHKKALEDKAQYLQKTLYQSSQEEYQRFQLTVTAFQSTIKGEAAAAQRWWGGVILGISLVIAITSIIVNIILK